MPSLLVIEDDPLVRDTIVRTLRPHYDVHEASSVGTALTALRQAAPDVVVLDLCLDREASALHDALVRREIPVVLVSGRDPDHLPGVAEERGWPYLTKPVDPATLRATVASALADHPAPDRRTPTMPPGTRSTTPPPATASTTPDPVVPPEAPPPASTSLRPAPLPDTRSERTQIHDAWSRRLKHVLVAAMVTFLAWRGSPPGHAIEWYIFAILGGLGMGTTGMVDALRKRPGTAVGGTAALVGLALLGDATGVRELTSAATLGVAGIPFLDDLVARVRG